MALAVQGGEKKEKEAWEVGEWKRGRLRLAVMMGIYATEFTLKGNAVHEVSAAGAASAAHLGLEHCLLGEPQRGHCLLVSWTESTAASSRRLIAQWMHENSLILQSHVQLAGVNCTATQAWSASGHACNTQQKL